MEGKTPHTETCIISIHRFFFNFNYTYQLVPIITCALWDKLEGPEDGSMPLLPVCVLWKMDRDYTSAEGSVLLLLMLFTVTPNRPEWLSLVHQPDYPSHLPEGQCFKLQVRHWVWKKPPETMASAEDRASHTWLFMLQGMDCGTSVQANTITRTRRCPGPGLGPWVFSPEAHDFAEWTDYPRSANRNTAQHWTEVIWL